MKKVFSGAILPLLAAAVLFVFVTALGNLEDGHQTQGKVQLEQAIRRAAVACYATEGVYPPDLAYLQQYYGIQVDESRYAVKYDAFAGNLMPDITVLERS